jgi:hypothetical protein
MSTRPDLDYAGEELSERAVHDYLAAHPDFFEKHSSLLGSLDLPHAAGGTVSLVERQISVLRQKEIRHEKQFKELIDVARANDLLSAKIHELTIQLFAAHDLKTTIIALEEGMRSRYLQFARRKRVVDDQRCFNGQPACGIAGDRCQHCNDP